MVNCLAGRSSVSEDLGPSMGNANLRWGEEATCELPGGILGFQAGLGVRPAEVYLPPPDLLDTQVPVWARGRHGEIVHAFEAINVRVVVLPDASAWVVSPGPEA